MAYRDLREFIERLKKEGELKEIDHPVSSYLEITEIADRVVKAGGPALLFKNVDGGDIPVAINLFASYKRMAMALEDDPDRIGEKAAKLLKPEKPTGFMDKLKKLVELKKIADIFPKEVDRRKAPCKEVIMKEPDLSKFPILFCWPKDGGRFITLPLVFTKDPETGERNCGMYRLHVYDKKTTGMHWHWHKVGAKHFWKAKKMGIKRFPVAVAIGSDPAVIYSATAPLPEDVDEMVFAGFLRGKPVGMVKCETVDLEVPANAEIILEGYVDTEEFRFEGPFGDHTGYYSLPDFYPVFHITCITHRRNPIYPATIVGKPPMEDCYIGKATERIFLPLLRTQLPEIVDMSLPIEGVFHNFAFISIDKRYPGHARKVISALWGMGQMSFTKNIIIFDKDTNVHDIGEVIWRWGNNVDPKRDIIFTEGPVDALDHTSPLPFYGSKMGVDATRKWPSEGFERDWPPDIEMDPEVVKKVDEIWDKLGLPRKEEKKNPWSWGV